MKSRTKLCTALLAFMLAGSAIANERLDAIRAEVRAGNAERAEQLAEQLLDAEPDNADAHNLYGNVLSVRINEVSMFRKRGMALRMRDAWEQAIELDPVHLDAHMSLLQFYLQAPAIAGGNPSKALALANQVSQLDESAGFRARASVLAADDRHEEVAAEYARAVEALPDNVDMHYRLGLASQQIEDWDRAFEAFNRTLSLDPEFMSGRYQIGRTAVLSGTRLEEGAAAMQSYLESASEEDQPPSSWAHIRLGQLYSKMDRLDDARAQFEAALALDPDAEEAKKQLAALE